MKTAHAFAPGNISLVFKVMAHPDPIKMGSLGVGFTTCEGATVDAVQGVSTQIIYNKLTVQMPTVIEVLRSLTKKNMFISITSPLLLGCGFGMSAASALGTAYAVNSLLSLGKSDLELAKIVHRAEVVHKTGLGDVVNQFYGGFFIKLVTSAKFQVQRLSITPIPVYCKSYGKLFTSSILSDSLTIKKINKEAESAISQMTSVRSFEETAIIANRFTRNTGLLTPDVEKMIFSIIRRGGHAAQILLGNAIVSDISFPGAIKLHMDTKKATVLT